MAKKIETQIIINAAPQKVWEILTDFNNYPNWNPFIKSISGSINIGSTLKVTIEPEEGKGMTFKPLVQSSVKKKELSWLGKLLFKGIFDGKHKFQLIDNGNGTTTFIQSEEFSGILVPFINLDKTAEGFNKMNQSLKEQAEKKNII
ncbi:SRPBCC domain-containing protein [Chryseobacterium soli]|uniref:SRPBCC domain-containing protein n=1 Tax=Chryseobacterium soli TaxID=445961 RepID=UPI002953A6EF|nr:SRPBCC domain-containing protein [Chryseobacterium soli]MDV7698329.1 SRPBCC domain-containing protein [Chryseobacterium soli]